MTNANRLWGYAGCALLVATSAGLAQDWPQWRGVNRDGKATGFTAPKTWPKELKETWKVSVGEGVATPALVGDKIVVFTRQGGKEVVRCLNAKDGKEIWKDEYDCQGASGPARNFSGPRSSPTVAGDKVVTLGLRGTLSCYELGSGKKVWRNEDIKSLPIFQTSSSPIVVDGLCIAQLGGQRDGVLIAYDLTTGKEKWKWSSDGTEYASLSLLTVGETKAIVAETTGKIVAVGATDGKLLWETPFPKGGGGGGGMGGGRSYNASTPMVEGETVIFSGSGRGTRAVKMEKKDKELAGKELWKNENAVQYNTPVLKDGFVYGLSSSSRLFCINAKDGKTAWTGPAPGGRGDGYGNIVDAGTVLLSLPPNGELTVFEPNPKEFKEIAKYKVGSGETYAYPIPSGKRIFVKDRDALILWAVE